MNKKQVIKKGYTVEIASWENDGDHYETNRMSIDSKEEAIELLKLCKEVFTSCNNGDGGIGNMNDGSSEGAHDIILKYCKENPYLIKDETNEDNIIDIIMNINYELMGSSEWYYSRVFDKGVIFYSPEDIFVEEILNSNRWDK